MNYDEEFEYEYEDEESIDKDEPVYAEFGYDNMQDYMLSYLGLDD